MTSQQPQESPGPSPGDRMVLTFIVGDPDEPDPPVDPPIDDPPGGGGKGGKDKGGSDPPTPHGPDPPTPHPGAFVTMDQLLSIMKALDRGVNIEVSPKIDASPAIEAKGGDGRGGASSSESMVREIEKSTKGRAIRISRFARRGRRMAIREKHAGELAVRTDEGLLKDLERVKALLEHLQSTHDTDLKALRDELHTVTRQMHAMNAALESFAKLHRREERVDEREHNEFLRARAQIEAAERLLEHAKEHGFDITEIHAELDHLYRLDRNLYTQFTERVTRIHQEYVQIGALKERRLDELVPAASKVFARIAHDADPKAPVHIDASIVARAHQETDMLVQAFVEVRDRVAHVTTLESELVAFYKGIVIRMRRARHETQTVTHAHGQHHHEVPAEHHADALGQLEAPALSGEAEQLKKSGVDVAEAKRQLQWIKNRVGSLADHTSRIDKIAKGKGMKQYLKWLADEAEVIERIPAELNAHLDAFHRSIAKLTEDDSMHMKIVERTTFAYGRLIGELAKKRDSGAISEEEHKAISDNIRKRGERIISVTKNLHLFVNWLKQSDDDFKQEFMKLGQSAPHVAQFIKQWHEWREKNPTIEAMRAHTADEKIRAVIEQHLRAMRGALANIEVIEKALTEYARFVKGTNALVAQDKAFFDGLAGKKGAARLAHLRTA